MYPYSPVFFEIGLAETSQLQFSVRNQAVASAPGGQEVDQLQCDYVFTLHLLACML